MFIKPGISAIIFFNLHFDNTTPTMEPITTYNADVAKLAAAVVEISRQFESVKLPEWIRATSSIQIAFTEFIAWDDRFQVSKSQQTGQFLPDPVTSESLIISLVQFSEVILDQLLPTVNNPNLVYTGFLRAAVEEVRARRASLPLGRVPAATMALPKVEAEMFGILSQLRDDAQTVGTA
ncbi:hypothetical protein B0I35DRAFT_515855 [Stachybotrys elegans]|uniref:Uncharacterized protein n=1 Tax=Stachybotrys elegans TaxID=80388 RepID=A0A8K0WMJ5_9HYPO|nr:hypothetical protein B0I35DRAFT_515855 [Stachybotrys elegans]